MKLPTWLLFFATLSGLHAAASRATPIVVFVADDLGWADLAVHGSAFHETPHLDRLAAEGRRFTAAYAASPVCSPTRASLLTGRWPQRSGITDYIGAPQPDAWTRNTVLQPAPYAARLEQRERTLAEALKAAGYATFFGGKWHLGPEGSWPEDHGFDVNLGGIDRGGPYGGKKYFSPYGNPRLPDGPPGEHLADRLAREAARFIAENRTRPFLVFLPFYDVHTPLMTTDALKAEYEENSRRLQLEERWGNEGTRDVRLNQTDAVYAGMVETMDNAVGTVLDALDANGLRESTLVIFTSDNGGLSTSEGWPTSNVPLRAGKGWLYEGGLRVPFIVRWPAVATAGGIVDTPVSSVDLMPTVLSAAGVPSHLDADFDGADLTPLLAGRNLPVERSLFWHYPHYGNQGGAPGAAIRRGDWKLVEWFEDGTLELFDLGQDAGESRDLASDRPDLVASLQQELHAWERSVGAIRPARNPAYDPAKPNGRQSPHPRASQGAVPPPVRP